MKSNKQTIPIQRFRVDYKIYEEKPKQWTDNKYYNIYNSTQKYAWVDSSVDMAKGALRNLKQVVPSLVFLVPTQNSKLFSSNFLGKLFCSLLHTQTGQKSNKVCNTSH